MDSPDQSRRPGLAIIAHFLHFMGVLIVALAVATIPKFVLIYRDLLGPVPLPALTFFVLRFQPLWIALAIFFALVALYALWRWRLHRVPEGISLALLLLPVGQATLLLVALLQPIAGTIVQEKPAGSVSQFAR